MKKLTALILTLTMLFSLCAFPVAAETETDNRVWFDLNGNSKFFVKKVSDTSYTIGEKTYSATNFTDFRTNFKDYLPGVDFAGFLAAPTGDFTTDQPLVVTPQHGGAMFLYTVDKKTDGAQYATPDFTTGEDGNLYWTINDVAYRVNPDENVIKVIKNGIDTSALEDADMIARYESVNAEAVIDVKDGRYKNVGILAGLNAGSSRNATVTLVYEDTTVEEKITIKTSSLSTETSYLTGHFYLQNFTNTGGGGSNAVGGHGFIPFTFETDPTKTLTAIKIKDTTSSSVKTCIYVVSAWGEMKTLAEHVAEIDALIEAADTVAELEAIDVEAVEEYFNCTLTEQRTAIASKIAEINRVENLTEGNKTYIDFVSQVSEVKAATKMDIFSDYQTMADYSMFNTALNSASAFNADMYHDGSAYVEADASYTGTTYKNRIPDTTTDGTAITGSEGFYKKGFATNANGTEIKNVPYIYDIDSIKNVGGTSTAIYHYNTANKSSAVAGTVKRNTKTQIIYKSKPDVEKIENTANGEYYYLKDGERTFKLGPAKSLEFSPNAVAAGQTATDAFSVNASGAYLDLAIGASNINNPTYSNLNIVTSSGGDYSPSIALQAVQVKYASGTETYYIPVWNAGGSDKDAILRSIMYAPKYDEAGNKITYTVTDVYKANTPVTPFTPLSDVADIKKDGVDTLTMDDIVCPGGTIVAGEMDVASFVYARQGQFYERSPAVAAASIPLKNEELISFTLTASLSSANAAAKTVENAIALSSTSNTSNLNRALIPVEIKGAKEEYVYYLYVGRLANYASSLIGATLRQEPMSVKIAELNAELDAVDAETITKEECEALRAKIEALKAANEFIADSDFHTAALEAGEARIRNELAEEYKVLKLKRNFPISETNGANAKLFIDYDTYQGYDENNNADEEWVKGLDYSGIANYNYSSTKDHTSYPTGTDADVIVSGNNSAFVYKIDKPLATSQYAGFVSLTTKNDDLVWNVDGTDFVINPYEKVVKVYTPTDASGVEDADLRARFATLDNPVLDIADGCYETITLLAGSLGKRNLTPTVIYKDGTSKKLTAALTKGNSFTTGNTQNDGWLYLKALTNWSNTNSGGAVYFGAITLTGFDTSKVVDKISFTSDKWGVPVFVISAFGETATIEEVLNSADASDLVKAKAALDIADDILAENNITVDNLTVELAAKYNELKEATAAFLIEEIALENNVVTVKYENTTAVDEKATLIVAQYNEDESELISVKYQPVTFVKGKTELTANVETTEGNKVKVFVWKDLEDFFPLTANIFGK